MRYMMIVKANEESEAGTPPSSANIAAMSTYNEQLIGAGILLGAEGLHASSSGVRARKEGGAVKLTDGPFTETKELVAGFWLIDVKTRDDAVAWLKRIPFEEGMVVELRKVHEASDFPADAVTEEHLAKEAAWREANQKPIRN